MPRKSSDESDLDSNAPLLPAPSTSAGPAVVETRQPTFASTLKWWHPVLGAATIVLLWTAISVSGVTSTPKDPRTHEDPKWPTWSEYRGPTPTGAEAAAAETSYPSNYDSSPLNPPPSTTAFNMLHYFGNLSPWRTVNHGLNTTAQVPHGCTLEQVQLLHRHGARYPESGAGTEVFARKVAEAKHFKASGDLAFLNAWEYKLGAELLTPFGREQLFNLGVSFRVKYGHLLESDSNKLPVYRTESQDRMLNSAKNFAAGFFGFPFEEQYHQLVTIEWPNFNNTLAPYMTCPNAGRRDLSHGLQDMSIWIDTYLGETTKRLQHDLQGLDLTTRDVFNMQLLCAYELVALGGSEFCKLFTEDEFRGFEYAHDLRFFESYSFGQPAQVALGKGWVQEWLARTLKQPITEFNSTTNSTLHTSKYFPLDQNLYVDATHDTAISAVITSLNFSTFARSGPLPNNHIPANLSFVTSSIAPFASNLHSQILNCPNSPLVPQGSRDSRFVRWILNDGVVPIANMEGCFENDDGLCHLESYIPALQKWLTSVDFDYECHGSYDLPSEPILDGRSPHASAA
ncbi:histidine phosphatase family protein [Sporobolomyces koalae]|uniref:histidine phosphatase family protein n=1 Tax=Sporobolomyces koalae TaxID=500713 RepID=UPI00317928B5